MQCLPGVQAVVAQFVVFSLPSLARQEKSFFKRVFVSVLQLLKQMI